MTRKIIEWIDERVKALLFILGGMFLLVFWARRDAVERHKDNTDETSNRRLGDALDASSDSNSIEPADLSERMRSKGWFRD
jgi:hypothetical protein